MAHSVVSAVISALLQGDTRQETRGSVGGLRPSGMDTQHSNRNQTVSKVEGKNKSPKAVPWSPHAHQVAYMNAHTRL